MDAPCAYVFCTRKNYEGGSLQRPAEATWPSGNSPLYRLRPIGSSGSDITYQHHLDSVITSTTRQCYHQHDLTAISRHDQYRIGSIIASMTRHRHCVTAMLPRQRHRRQDSTATSRHDQHRLGSATVNIGSEAPSSA
jgi:hypothetical protein